MAEPAVSSSGPGCADSKDSGAGGALPAAKALVPEVPLAVRAWERLFGNSSLLQYLSASESRRCRRVCRDWRRLTGTGATEEELWSSELGPTLRGVAWKQLLLCGITLKVRAGTHQDEYERLCEKESPYDSTIRRDVNRTLPSEDLFRERNGKGQVALFRLLRALAIRLCDIGYCQSLNFIVATLIGVFPDDEATVFQCALALLLRHSLVDLYRPKFPKLGVVVWQFDRIVEGFLPKVHIALVRHGVNSEYYAIQWFLTLFASDLQQPVVRRVWDRFLVAGWRIVVQVGLALLYTVQDILPSMETCEALTFLRKFARDCRYGAEDLLNLAATFKVSHRMLSALEAAYNWEDDVQLLVIKDLNSGHVHWAVQAVPPPPPSVEQRSGDEGEEDFEMPPAIPRAFSRTRGGGGPGGAASSPDHSADLGGPLDGTGDGEGAGNVLPFLLKNLDTGEEKVIDEAWSQYTSCLEQRARAAAGPVQAEPSAASSAAGVGPGGAGPGGAGPGGAGAGGAGPGAGGASLPNGGGGGGGGGGQAGGPATGGGSSWMQSVQRQAVRRLSQEQR